MSRITNANIQSERIANPLEQKKEIKIYIDINQ